MAYDEFGQWIEEEDDHFNGVDYDPDTLMYSQLNKQIERRNQDSISKISKAIEQRLALGGYQAEQPQIQGNQLIGGNTYNKPDGASSAIPFNWDYFNDQPVQRDPVEFEGGSSTWDGVVGALKGLGDAIPFVGSHITTPVEMAEAPSGFGKAVDFGTDLVAGFGEGALGTIAGGALTANPLGAIAGAGVAAGAGDLARSAEQYRIEQERQHDRDKWNAPLGEELPQNEGSWGYDQLDAGDVGQAALSGLLAAGGAKLGHSANTKAINKIASEAVEGNDVLKTQLAVSIAKQLGYDTVTGAVEGMANVANQMNLDPNDPELVAKLTTPEALKQAGLAGLIGGATSAGAQAGMLGGLSGLTGKGASPDSDLGIMRSARESGKTLKDSYDYGIVEQEDIDEFLKNPRQYIADTGQADDDGFSQPSQPTIINPSNATTPTNATTHATQPSMTMKNMAEEVGIKPESDNIGKHEVVPEVEGSNDGKAVVLSDGLPRQEEGQGQEVVIDEAEFGVNPRDTEPASDLTLEARGKKNPPADEIPAPDKTEVLKVQLDDNDPQSTVDIRPIGSRGLYDLATDLVDNVKLIKKGKKQANELYKNVNGYFKVADSGKREIALKAGIGREIGENPTNRVFAHEIGHAIDHIVPEDMTPGTSRESQALYNIKMLKNELEARFKSEDNPEVNDEVMRFSELWRPYDKDNAGEEHIAYRNSDAEKIADAYSAFLANPKFLQDNAPKVMKFIANEIHNNPKAKQAWDKVQEVMGMTPENRLGYESEKIGAGFRRGKEKHALEIKKKREGVEENKTPVTQRLKENFVDKFDKVYKKEESLVRAGERSDFVTENLIQRSEWRAAGAKFEMKFRSDVKKPLENIYGKENLDDAYEDLGMLAFLRRISSGDRGEFENPMNMTKSEAKELQATLEKKLSDAGKLEVADKVLGEMNDGFQRILKEYQDLGIISKTAYKKYEKNKNYAPFVVVDFMRSENSPMFGKIKPMFQKQEGTFREVSNPFEEGMLRQLAMDNYLEFVKAQTSALSVLLKTGQAQKSVLNEAGQLEPLDKNKGRIFRYHKGSKEYYDVDKSIADAFEILAKGKGELPMGLNWLANALNPISRTLMLTLNPIFGTRQLIRDPQGVYLAMPKKAKSNKVRDAYDLFKAYKSAWKEAGEYIKADKMSKDIYDLIEGGIINIAGQGTYSGKDLISTHERLLHEFGRLEQTDPTKFHRAIQGIMNGYGKWAQRYIDNMTRFTERTELLPKIALKKLIEERGGLTKTQTEMLLRNGVGTPNYKRGGQYAKEMNALFQFSNVTIQGMRHYLGLFKGANKARYTKDIANKMIQGTIGVAGLSLAYEWAMESGLFGDEAREAYEKVSDYKRGNYHSIWLGTWKETGDGGREPVMLEIPLFEPTRFVKGLVHSGLRQATNAESSIGERVFDALGGFIGGFYSQTPSMSSILNSALEITFNRDTFRDKPILDATEENAPESYKMKKWALHVIKSIGLSENLNPINAPKAIIPTWGRERSTEPIPVSVQQAIDKQKGIESEKALKARGVKSEAFRTRDKEFVKQSAKDGLITDKQRDRILRELNQGLTLTESSMRRLPEDKRKELMRRFNK